LSGHPEGSDARPGGAGAASGNVRGYVPIEKLGERTWKARRPDGRGFAALRLVEGASDPKVLDSLKRVCEAAAKLDHPAVAKVSEFGLDEATGVFFIATEFVEGESLESLVSRLGGLTEPNALAVATQLAGALDCAYGHGLCHGDLRPSSVIVTPEGRAVLTGFGAAPVGGAASPYASPDGTPIGPAGIRSDIYSLGALLYRAVTGRAPRAEACGEALVLAPRPGALPWPAEARPGVSERLSLIIAKAMAVDPAERYQTPTELLLDLGIVAQGQPPVIASKVPPSSAVAAAGAGAAPSGPVREREGGAPAPRRRGAALVAGGVLAVAAAVVAAVVLTPARPDAATEASGKPEPAEAAGRGVSRPAPEDPRGAVASPALGADIPPAPAAEGPERSSESRRRNEALAALEDAWARARSSAASGDYDAALAELERLSPELAREVEPERRDAAAKLLAEAREKLESALAQAERTLSDGDPALARAALEAAETVSCGQVRREAARRIEALRKRIAAAEERSRAAALAKANEAVRAFGAEFVSLAAKGDQAAARRLAEQALASTGGKEGPLADLLRAASRVAAALDERAACIQKAAGLLVGSQATLRTKSGPRKGVVVSVGPDGITLAARVIINGEVRGESRFVVGWADLAPDEEEKLAESWSAGGDSEIARALLALGRHDAASAEKALGLAGAHLLAPFVRSAIDGLKTEAAEASAASAWSEIEKALAPQKLSSAQGKALLDSLSAFEKQHAGTRFLASLGTRLASAKERAEAAAAGGSSYRAPPTRGLRLWLRADAGLVLNGELVSQWADQSGGRIRAVQAERARQPRFLPEGLAGRPAIQFDGDNDQLVLTECPAQGDFTLAFVAAARRPHEIDQEAVSGASGTHGQRYLFGATLGGGSGVSMGTNGISVYEHDAYFMPALAVYRGGLGRDPVVAVVRYESKQPSIFLNGTLARKGLTSPRPAVQASREIGSGAYGAFEGALGEVLVYDSALSDADRSAVEAYLGRKYLGKSLDELRASARAGSGRPEHPEGKLPDGGGELYVEEQGRCVIEAERFSAVANRGDGARWSPASSTAGYVGEGYMVAAAPAGPAQAATWETGCELAFVVSIQTPGKYYVALRCRGPTAYSDSVFVGVDGEDRSAALGYFSQASRGWIWLRGLAPLGELAKGVHTIQVRRREAGFELDRLMLSTDESALPANRSTEPGPRASLPRKAQSAAGSARLLPEAPPARTGLESGEWAAVEWANPVKIARRESGGLAVTVAPGGGKDKAALVLRAGVATGGKTGLRLGVRNASSEPVEIAVAFGTPAGYFESRPVAIPAGRRVGMAVDLRARDFKCEATRWEFASEVVGAEEARELYILVYSGPRAAAVEFDGIAFE